MLAVSLYGLTLLSVVVCFAIGVFIAYGLWGIRYFRVLDAEASIVLLQRKAERLRQEQDQLNSRLRDM